MSVEAFSLFLSIQYVAMIIIGGMGSLLGALLGAVFVTLFPYAIEAALLQFRCPALRRCAVRRELRRLRCGNDSVPRVRAAWTGRVWPRVQSYFLLWPFKPSADAGPR